MADLTAIREALRDPTIAAYPDFTTAINDVCDELERLRNGIKRLADKEELCAADALRLVVAYDDLLRSHEGPSDTLFAGDFAEIDAAYDKMVAAVRFALDETPPVREVRWTQNDVERENSAFSEWFKERGYPAYPEHYPLITENAMHAAWQEASRRATINATGATPTDGGENGA